MGAIPWPRCTTHPHSASTFVCPRCVTGSCDACTEKVQGGAICAACNGLCMPARAYGEKEDVARRRRRPMSDDLGVIAKYPLLDGVAFVLLALFVWFLAIFGLGGWVLGQSVLMLYTFHSLTRVSIGDLRSSMPQFTDVADLLLPARLALAVFLISAGPLIAVLVLVPGAVTLVVDTRRLPGMAAFPPSPAALPLLVLALLWNLAYTPVALTVAALSRSYLSTLNPVIGIGTIKRMGETYWHAMAIACLLAFCARALGFGLAHVPLAGALVRSFADAYAQLAIACTLGLAVFKKAEALAWD